MHKELVPFEEVDKAWQVWKQYVGIPPITDPTRWMNGPQEKLFDKLTGVQLISHEGNRVTPEQAQIIRLMNGPYASVFIKYWLKEYDVEPFKD